MNCKILSIAIFTFSFLTAASQTAPQKEWDKTFGERRNDQAYSIIQTMDKGFAIAGSQSRGLGGALWLILTDENGKILRNKLSNSIYLQQTTQIRQTKDKGFVSIGISNSADFQGVDVALIKTDHNLNESWSKSYSADKKNMPVSVVETTEGGFAIVAVTGTDDDSDNSNIALFRTDPNGNLLWQKQFNYSKRDFATKIIQAEDNGFLITGYTSPDFFEPANLYVLKTDDRGNIQWEKQFGGSAFDQATDAVQIPNGNYIIIGSTLSKGQGWSSAWVLKLNPEGELLWDKTYGGSSNDEANAVIIDGNGCIIAGSTRSKGAGDWDVWIFKIDTKGNLLWEQTFGDKKEERAYSLTKTFDDGLAVAGRTNSKGAGRHDVWLLKLNFSVRDRATAFVQNNISEWETKGRFEKMEDYTERVNHNTRQQKIFELSDQFFGQIGIPIFESDIKTAKLDYDTESEVFRISLTYYNPIYIPLPIDEAKSFDSNFNKLKYSNIRFNLTPKDKLEIARMSIKNPANGKIYFFDAATPIVYNDQTVVQKFKPIDVLPNPYSEEQETESISDLDTDIPTIAKEFPNRYALIIGNKNYIEYGSDIVDVPFAANDAKVFKNYAIKVLGIPDKSNHIYYIEDANATYIQRYIDNFSKLIKNAPDNSEFYVYYSGHGTHNEANEAYIIPVGVTSDYVEQFGIKLSDFYKKLSPTENKKVVAFIDACFSGGGKSGQMLVNARTGLRRAPKTDVQAANMLIFAASSERQISQEYIEKQHGLFTYFLLKTLKDTKGNLTYSELANRIYNDVTTTALNPENNLREQNPTVNVSPSAENVWKNWKVNP